MPNIEPAFQSFETVEATLDTDEHGLATAKVSYYASTDSAMLELLRSGKTCPLVAAGMMRSAKFTHGSASQDGNSAGIWKVSLTWRGAGVHTRVDAAAVPIIKPTASTEPIEAHPQFERFAGKPGATKNNAQFDDQNNFVRFPPRMEDGVTTNPKAGVKSYYQASLKVGEKRVIQHEKIQSESQWFSVGKISEPDVDKLVPLSLRVPGIPDQIRDYLLTGVTLDDLGNGYAMLTRDWDMSGPFGWDKDIYDYEDTGDASTPTP